MTAPNPILKPDDEQPAAAVPTTLRNALMETVWVDVDAFVGQTRMTLQAIDDCKPGTILTLDRTIADLVDLKVNGLTVATGELVSFEDRLAVRITSVGS